MWGGGKETGLTHHLVDALVLGQVLLNLARVGVVLALARLDVGIGVRHVQEDHGGRYLGQLLALRCVLRVEVGMVHTV